MISPADNPWLIRRVPSVTQETVPENCMGLARLANNRTTRHAAGSTVPPLHPLEKLWWVSRQTLDIVLCPPGFQGNTGFSCCIGAQADREVEWADRLANWLATVQDNVLDSQRLGLHLRQHFQGFLRQVALPCIQPHEIEAARETLNIRLLAATGLVCSKAFRVMLHATGRAANALSGHAGPAVHNLPAALVSQSSYATGRFGSELPLLAQLLTAMPPPENHALMPRWKILRQNILYLSRTYSGHLPDLQSAELHAPLILQQLLEAERLVTTGLDDAWCALATTPPQARRVLRQRDCRIAPFGESGLAACENALETIRHYLQRRSMPWWKVEVET